TEAGGTEGGGLKWVHRSPVPGDVDAPGDPDSVEAPDVVEETPKAREPSRLPDETAVEADAHHLGHAGLPLRVEAIEAVLEVLEELFAIGKARGGHEPHVVGRERVRDDELRFAVVLAPVRQVVVVGVGDVFEAAFLGNEVDGV